MSGHRGLFLRAVVLIAAPLIFVPAGWSVWPGAGDRPGPSAWPASFHSVFAWLTATGALALAAALYLAHTQRRPT